MPPASCQIVFLARLRFHGPRARVRRPRFVAAPRSWTSSAARRRGSGHRCPVLALQRLHRRPVLSSGRLSPKSPSAAPRWGQCLPAKAAAVLGGIAMLRYRPARPLRLPPRSPTPGSSALRPRLQPPPAAGRCRGGPRRPRCRRSAPCGRPRCRQRPLPGALEGERLTTGSAPRALALGEVVGRTVGPGHRVPRHAGRAAALIGSRSGRAPCARRHRARAAADPGPRPRPGSTSGQPDARHNPSCNLNS